MVEHLFIKKIKIKFMELLFFLFERTEAYMKAGTLKRLRFIIIISFKKTSCNFSIINNNSTDIIRII